ncbi:cysteine/serine-rich nuclear protein 3 isoform X1 [Triplophysa dalaica]|uniref:cysteine/serine-rich nuclear protein 3 isoform X1 n=2 Tax=Triplophysa dalaica TaxID=1582913 RepID=UPI0024DF9357|nr:cysteine/serine-rich nuclear protein 3 isoform X1 [Triplophysa dalaica]
MTFKAGSIVHSSLPADMSGILKRKFEEVEGASPCSSVRESEEEEISSTESGDSSDSVNPSASHFNHSSPASSSSSSHTLQRTVSILKQEKRMRTRRVRFEKVTVYYFSRRQGFTSVPSQGGSTLGMSSRHNCVRQYTLGEFAMEQERIHRDMLRDHLKEEKLNSIRLRLTKNGAVESEEASALTLDDISDDDLDIDNTEVDEYFFLQPLTTKKRRALLRSSGVKKIDVEEKHELRAIRVSREDCGCDCRLFCDPETCTCSLAGIKCQVDRMSFPCGCTKEGCSNAAGRIEFNPIRVRTHFLHTIMKLELEKSREQQQISGPATTATGNGFHGDPNIHCSPLTTSQHALEYAIPDSVPPSTIMHLQAGADMDDTLEEEDDEEEEDEEEEEEEEDDDEEDENEDEDESSSLCSLSDSSTQSLANSDSEDEDDEDKPGEFEAGLSTATTCGKQAPPPPVMCYTENTVASENQTNGNSYFMSSTPEYYTMKNVTPPTLLANANQASEVYGGDTTSYQDRVNDSSNVMSQGPFNVTSDQYTDYTQQSEQPYSTHHFTAHANGSTAVIGCRTPEVDKSVQSKGTFVSQSGELSQMELQNYLNNNNNSTQDAYTSNGNCYVAEQPKEMGHNLPDVSIADNTKGPALLDAFPEPTPV